MGSRRVPAWTGDSLSSPVSRGILGGDTSCPREGIVFVEEIAVVGSGCSDIPDITAVNTYRLFVLVGCVFVDAEIRVLSGGELDERPFLAVGTRFTVDSSLANVAVADGRLVFIREFVQGRA